MLRYIVYFGCALFSLFFSITCPLYAAGEEPATALSPDGTLRTLAANAETWFRFDYGGSHSPLQIELTDSGLADIRFSLHTPEQLADWRRGLALKAIGQIARAGGVPNDNLRWAGHFQAAGTYYIVVRNLMNITVSYRLVVSGPTISSSPNTADQASNSQATNTASSSSLPTNSNIPSSAPSAEFAIGGIVTLTPDAAQALASKNSGVIILTRSTRLIAGAVYPNVSFQLAKSGVQLVGDPNHPPTIIAPAGKYGIVAHNVIAPTVKFINIQTSTLAQDQWKWYSDITNYISDDAKYGGILFKDTQIGVIRNVTIIGADGTTDGASHSAGISGITLLNTIATLVAKNKLNGNIFGIIIAGGKDNLLLDNVIQENIRQGLVPGTGDLCNGCDSAAIAITYGSGASQSRNNIIGLPGHGNWISGGNGIFVIFNGVRQTGAGAGNFNFFVENNIAAEWNGVEAVATEGNIFARNIINFSKNTVGYWMTGSTFTMDSRYEEGMLGALGKIQVQITDKRFGYNLSGVMHVVENPQLPDLAALPSAAREFLRQQPPHSPYEPIP